MSERIARLNLLRDALYELPLGGTGGPLHILVEDGNVCDSDLVHCYVTCHDESTTVAMKVLGLAILHELMFMKETERRAWVYGMHNIQE